MPRDAAARALPRPRLGPPPAPRVPEAQRFTLDNGLRVVAVERPGLPQVVLRLMLPTGSGGDPAGRAGTAALTAQLLGEGTATRPAAALHAALDGLGAAFSAQATHDGSEVEMRLLAETLDAGLSLLAELLCEPAFPPGELERVRAELLDALEARLDDPANVADDRLMREVFGPEHPYGRLSIGTPDAVAMIARDELAGFHARHYRPAGAVLVAAGSVPPATLLRSLERSFAGWLGEAAAPALPPVPAHAPGAGRCVELPWPDAAQAELRLGGLGMERSSRDWVPGIVANYLLGGSTITGRLGRLLREEKGWTYGVRSGFSAGRQPGGWVVETAVEAEAAEAALEATLAEIERLCREPVGDDELQRARDALVLSLPRAFETPGRIVSRFATIESYGLAPDYWQRFAGEIAAVDAAAVQEMANRYFRAAGLARVLVR